MKLHRPSSNDFAEITTVWEASVRATHTFLSEEDIAFFRPLVLNEYLKNVNLYCLKDEEGAIIAFMGIAENNLEMLFIHPDQRGKGLGKYLVNYATTQLGIDSVDVNEQNEQAVGFYYKMGFEVVSRDETDGMGKPFPILHLRLKDI
ncbi:GNAT family N-acetyltransferase [Bacteroides sp. 224]|uniref:GNAT family N-acetyltransferase n=1 Tax=Bacteroides sp. 224 TaxID=2302936 RepID=UPI0013D141CE|nr:GNAT family N-acetyltransferase [Bacteroides sp. 224]NDV66461.1 GNAT family N-acetyltransferase [Bacteroides sp. 224]